jgi:hypothetical protein
MTSPFAYSGLFSFPQMFPAHVLVKAATQSKFQLFSDRSGKIAAGIFTHGSNKEFWKNRNPSAQFWIINGAT